MDPSVVAVTGTLAGVLISAIAAILGALVAGRNQRAIAASQAAHELGKADRDERRRAFVAFLDAYDAAFAAGERLAARATTGGVGDPHQELTEQIRALRHTYHVLTITSGAGVREASDECLGTLWDLYDVAADRDEFLAAAGRTSPPRSKLREAMRTELGVQ